MSCTLQQTFSCANNEAHLFQTLTYAGYPGRIGGALRLSGSVTLVNATFTSNSAQSEGPAISNDGEMSEMKNVTFNGNFFVCVDGEYLEYVEVGSRLWA